MPKTWHFRLNFPTENAEASSVKMINKTVPENTPLMPKTAYSHVYFKTEASSVKIVKKKQLRRKVETEMSFFRHEDGIFMSSLFQKKLSSASWADSFQILAFCR